MSRPIEQIQDIKGLVKNILGTYPITRDNDRALMVKVWESQSHELNNMFKNCREFFIEFTEGSYANPESIMRTRRKVQERYATLRGKYYGMRKTTLEQEVRNNINTIEV